LLSQEVETLTDELAVALPQMETWLCCCKTMLLQKIAGNFISAFRLREVKNPTNAKIKA
jgi:hypothetical protein